ncbi:MAG: hypothetical protein IPG60_14345 [Bacteroidetes bacterium]|nr:hypothetical protein [Bacteroidota bacterium]MBP7398952.1 hypothetical protein [Chitinophagales bacterium]MBK7110194.1 hypothetical protein [Bacteroidota bacterium]MBK8487075.1 hypothetical protein [Bacteroidota bacterium]MBK8680464.1 hypothetical protein [Bacteroidota bacterium]
MKKSVLLLTLLAAFSFLFSACQQCSTCTYEYTVSGNPATYSEEYCGSKSEVDKFESDFEQDAAAVQANAACTRK